MNSATGVKQSSDIVRLSANTVGRDYIIADLHGNKECLASVLNELHFDTHDRLFIAGDLVDRGEDSVGVIQLILTHRRAIHVIRGNHEEMTLRSINALEIILSLLAKQNPAFSFSKKKILKKMQALSIDPGTSDDIRYLMLSLNNHIENNGGDWILDLFQKEYAEHLISVNPQFMIEYEAESKVKMISSFMNSLPYIISVAGAGTITPFHVVHADLPIHDIELERRIRNKQGLTAEEKQYAIWARGTSKDTDIPLDPLIGRLSSSTIAYCGHQIIGYQLDDCLRAETSMVDLDGAAYYTHISLLADHTDRRVIQALGHSLKIAKEDSQRLAKTAKTIQLYLTKKHHENMLRLMVRAIVNAINAANPEKISSLLTEGLEKINIEISKISERLNIKEWTLNTLIAMANTDPFIEPDAQKKYHEQIIADLLLRIHSLSSSEQVDSTKKQIGLIANTYYTYHADAPLSLQSLLEKPAQNPSKQASSSALGVFGKMNNTERTDAISAERAREMMLQLVNQLKTTFIDQKSEEYLDNLDPNKAFDEVVQCISAINLKIQLHNETYPRATIPFFSYENFFRENEFSLFCDLDKRQSEYMRTCLKIEDIKQQVTQEISQLDHDQIGHKIKKSHEMISNLIAQHNLQHELQIKPISLQDFHASITIPERSDRNPRISPEQ